MSNNDEALNEVKSVMASAILKLKNIIDNNHNQKVNFEEILSTFLYGIISTTAELAELSSPGAKQRIYTNIEARSRKSWIDALHELGDDYSLSDIQPDDMAGAMNYLGKAMSIALFKGLYELPKPLQNEEILLRAIEALLANLLDQKFSHPHNPHSILDSFCEHVHIVLNDLENTPSDKKTNMNREQPSNNSTKAIVKNINDHANDILFNGGGDEALLLSLHDVMDKIKEVMDTSTQQEMDDYCEEYNGFYRYVSLLDQLAAGIANGLIKVPK